MDFVVEEAEKSVNGLFWYITEEGKFEQAEQDIDDVAQAYPGRDDLAFPTRLVRDENGTVIGADGLSRIA